MNLDVANSLLDSMLWNTAKVAAPVLITSLVVGLIISIFQVITQIQEMTLTFVPKMLAILGVLFIFGPWILTTISSYATALFSEIPNYIG
ncbi:flagellar biosynthesis protein FliQ [Zooshikella marina]|uniref:Flagellar biosynthetic protein FliQ n=1 Tax=Zooshikella ganghwensis TaxID=202772 RepID=A0A4P9VS60_9GAMM|nr:flagellar biosynthesis protein FliQ [Zooshikella ganghwensis]MBU2705921.1 flagellar biosynthesis protein FliQ [Zooshikella ganghwensis]RDH46465.1 flagellar biosynthetic protein FliQ [Zooshikella ganghwensis]